MHSNPQANRDEDKTPDVVAHLSTLTLHVEVQYPPGPVNWSTPTIDRHAQMTLKYVLAHSSDSSHATFLFSEHRLDDSHLATIGRWPSPHCPPPSPHGPMTEPTAAAPTIPPLPTVQYRGNIKDDLALLLDRHDIIQIFNAEDLWSLLRTHVWAESEQRLFPWRRKTRDLVDAIKKSKAGCWFPTLASVTGCTPNLYASSPLSEDAWSLVEQATLLEQASLTETGDLADTHHPATITSADEPPTSEGENNSLLLCNLPFALLKLHQTVALFHRASDPGQSVQMRKGGRGRTADSVVSATLPPFRFPPVRSRRFDSVFQHMLT